MKHNRYIKPSHNAGNRSAATHRVGFLIGYGLLGVALLLIAIGVAVAQEVTANGVTVANPWARATPGGVQIGGAYLEMKAAANSGDRLVGARSPAADAVEIHSHVMEGGVMKMRRVDAVDVPAGKSVVLAPGGYHLMLTGLKAPLKQGDHVKLTLQFEKAGEIAVEAPVEAIGAMGPGGAEHKPAQATKNAGSHQH